MKELIKVLKNNPNNAYDYLTSNYYKMSKEELKDFAKELLYSVYQNVLDSEHDKILNDVAEELENQYEE